MPKAADVDSSKYGVFYASAGHAALTDYPTATALQKITEQVWANGGIVSSVCHGPAIFANVIDPATNEALIKGKRITGFTTEAEYDMKIYDELKSWNTELVEELAARLGATCKLASSSFLCAVLDTNFTLQMSEELASGMTSASSMAAWSLVGIRKARHPLPEL
ncbi:unnamed protein product [Sphagnum balticum]